MRAGLLAVLLLAACTGASPSPSSTAEPVRQLAEDLGGAFFEPFSVAAVTTADEYAELWDEFSRSEEPPAVDFSSEIAIYFGMAGSSSCPSEFTGLVVDAEASHVHAAWRDVAANVACTDDLQSQGVLLAVSRSALPAGEFELTLRQQLVCAECPDHPDRVIVTL